MGVLKESFVPFQMVRSDKVKIEVESPGLMPVGQMAVDVEALEQVCDMAGIAELNLRIVNEEVGETMRGVKDCVMTALSARFGTFERRMPMNAELAGIVNKSMSEVFVHKEISLEDIENEVIKRDGLEVAEIWAEELNRILCELVLIKGLEHLLLRPNARALKFHSFGFAFGALAQMVTDDNFYLYLPVGIYNAKTCLEDLLRGLRLSMIQVGGVELDRALVFTIAWAIKTVKGGVVKALES